MALLDYVFGSPLASSEERSERVGPARGVPIFGLDALSSASYGPEAALTVLLPLGIAGLAYIIPITLAIVVLLAIVYTSYYQTIGAYPQGAGSYTVAKTNLGQKSGLLAAAALMIDYLLNVAVAISAGVEALVSALPALQQHTLSLCLVILAVLTIANLRGVREPGALFLAPTYAFVACMFIVIAWGTVQVLFGHGHAHAYIASASPERVPVQVGYWIILKAFASGCTAMTGVEAVSNGVQAFREPVVRFARTTLTVIIAILIVLLLGIAFLTHAYRIQANPPGQTGFQSVLSQLISAVAGHGVFYGITIASILCVLCLSANTSFADFPRVCRAVAIDGFLPRSLANRGRRLVYSEGIVVLAILSAGTLTLFGGITDRLIPLFAVGAFGAFTLSQAGMVGHWLKAGGKGALTRAFINAIGALATCVTTVIIFATKFSSGAWLVAFAVPAILALMTATRRHYSRVDRETTPKADFVNRPVQAPLVVVPVECWNSTAQKAVNFALGLSPEVEIVHLEYDGAEALSPGWEADVELAARSAAMPMPRVTKLASPYRFVIQPVLDYVLRIEESHPGREIAVVIPMLVERHWYHYFLHNQRTKLLSGLLLMNGNRRIVVVGVPWYLS